MDGLRFRLVWPFMLITICLVALCAFTALSLFRQQATLTQVLQENVAGRRAAVELEETIRALIDLENAHDDSAGVLHARVRSHLRQVAETADQETEKVLLGELTAGFDDYQRHWRGMPRPGATGHDAAFEAAAALLRDRVLKPCEDFKLYNARRIEESTRHHEQVLRQLAWGMAGIGGLGGVAGLVLGYGVARGLSRSIRRLQFQIQDAAGKLAPEMPEIVLAREGDFHGLHDQVDQLAARIERVVKELQQREHEVLRAEQLAAVGQLAAGVAHEIRNPLTGIKMLVQAAQEDPPNGGLTPEDLVVIEGEVRKMERSLQTFLDFARPPEPERRPVELLGVVNSVLGLVRGRAEKQRVAVKLSAPVVPVTLVGDGGQLQQVMVNLMLNALDAMPCGGVLGVTVRCRPAGIAEVEVADTGPGIAREVMGRLFEPFVSSKDTGLGLGLVISRRIVEDHGGRIGATNRSGGGASFFVTLPVAR